MSTTSRRHIVTNPDPVESDTAEVGGTALRRVLAVLRLSLGWVFLWAFLDKAFALGYDTGKNPTTGGGRPLRQRRLDPRRLAHLGLPRQGHQGSPRRLLPLVRRVGVG